MGKQLDGKQLDLWLRAAGSNRSQLAKALERNRSAITNLIKGARRLQLDEAPTIAQHAGVPLDAVFAWAGLGMTGNKEGALEEMKQSEFSQDRSAPLPTEKEGKPKRHPAWGIWKGRVTLLPDVDYTQPADPEWGKVYED